MTIGDVLATVCAVLLVTSSWIALLLLAAFLMPQRVAAARERIEIAPLVCAARGAAAFILALILTVVIYGHAAGPRRLLAGVLMAIVIGGIVTGSAAIVQIIAGRSDSGAPIAGAGLPGMTRAAILYVLAGLFPICGWLLVIPVALFVSLGAALPARASRKSEQPIRIPTDLAEQARAI